ncbi:MAG: carbon monoxide dehydrogenase subunit G [Acetobacteraceae bacterium]|nr:carbon monoxide dehydrogenase subunit G [Acetobacteraceae bacterium]
MDMTGERLIPAPRTAVWEALNDVDVLKASIPGCQEITRHSETELSARVGLKIGPVNATFTGKVQISDLDPPNGYTIGGEGSGGAAGFAKGGAKVRLADAEAGATRMNYDVSAQVGGKIAQLGARLIDSTAKRLADQFFDRFVNEVTARLPAAGVATAGIAVAAAGRPAAPAPGLSLFDLIPDEPFGLPRIAWAGIVIQLVIMILLFGTYLR